MLVANKDYTGFEQTVLFAICKAVCNRCQNEDWLYIPQGTKYGLLCEKCMDEEGVLLDKEATKKNLGACYPK